MAKKNKINTKIIIAVAIIIILGGLVYYLTSEPAPEKKSVPKGISKLNLNAKSPESIVPQLTTQQQQDLKELESLQFDLIKKTVDEYLSSVYLPNVKQKKPDVNLFISMDALQNGSFIGDRSLLTFPKFKEKVVSTLNVDANMDNLKIGFASNLTPYIATLNLSMVSSYLLKDEKRLAIKMSGEVIMEPVGDEWRIFGLKLKREQSLYEKKEDENI